MIRTLYYIFLIGIVSCGTNDPRITTVNLGMYTVQVPDSWKKIDRGGVDSYNGLLTNGKDTLWIYSGRYPSMSSTDSDSDYLYMQSGLGGQVVTIQKLKADTRAGMMIRIGGLHSEETTVMGAENIRDTNAVMAIFQSIQASNKRQVPISDFEPYPNGSGLTMHTSSCGMCHQRYKDDVGPALSSNFLAPRDSTWFNKFFFDRRSLASDSLYVVTKSRFSGWECISGKDYTKDAVDRLVRFLKSE